MKVIIFDKVYIPGLGMGPFYDAVELKDPRMVKTISCISSSYRFIYDEDLKKVIEEPAQTIEVIKEPKPVEVIEDVIEDVVEEVIEEAPTLEEVVETYTKEEVEELTIEELKAILDANGKKYKYKDTKTKLAGMVVGLAK